MIVGTIFSIMPAFVYWLAGTLAINGDPNAPTHRRHRGLHDAPVPALLPARPAAQRAGRGPGRAGPVRPHLRVPRPGAGDRGRAGRRRRWTRATVRGQVRFRDVSFRYPTEASRRAGPRGRGRDAIAVDGRARPAPTAATPVDEAALETCRRDRGVAESTTCRPRRQRCPFALEDIDFEAPSRASSWRSSGRPGSGKTTTTYLRAAAVRRGRRAPSRSTASTCAGSRSPVARARSSAS